MTQFDRAEEQALQALDDLQLEVVRAATVANRDERFEAVVRVLIGRAVPAIERVCRTRGKARGLGAVEIAKAIEDAATRTLLRLARPDRQPPVRALATEIAAACMAAQQPRPSSPPRLASRHPDLRVVNQLGQAIDKGQVRRNDWRGS